jgi:20S proteasome alpha/beta subunit
MLTNVLSPETDFESTGKIVPLQFRPKQKRKPVTLIVGIVCKDQIVIASDSRTTFPSHIQEDTKKISVLEFKCGKALVAHAGFTALSGDAIDILTQRAANFDPKHFRDLPELAQTVLNELYVRQASVYKESQRDSIHSFMRDNVGFALILAFFHERKPYIYTLNFPMLSIEKATTHFAATGQGETLGAYLMKEYTDPGMDSELGIAVAVYVVETVGKHDKTVGGPTRVGIVENPSHISAADALAFPPPPFGLHSYEVLRERCYLLSENNVAEIASVVTKVGAAMKQSQNKKLKAELRRQSEKKIKKMLGDDYYSDEPDKKPRKKNPP